MGYKQGNGNRTGSKHDFEAQGENTMKAHTCKLAGFHRGGETVAKRSLPSVK